MSTFHSTLSTLSSMACACALALCSGGASAASIPEPGDYTALPPGADAFIVYAFDITGDDVYAKGSKVPLPGDLGLKADLGLLRWVHYMKLGDYVLGPQVIAPFGRQKVALSGAKSSGLGDLTFGATLWTLADQKTGEHLGFSAFFTGPTGGDKNQGYAISNNRWAADLQFGYIRRLSETWTIDLNGQAELYQDQRSSGAERDPLVRGFAHLRYFFNPGTYVAATYRHAWGARETLNGTELSGRLNDSYVQGTWATFLTPTTQLELLVGQDLKVENGPKLRTLGARVFFVF